MITPTKYAAMVAIAVQNAILVEKFNSREVNADMLLSESCEYLGWSADDRNKVFRMRNDRLALGNVVTPIV